MAVEYINRYGRKFSRGVRPWLLLPKIIGIMMLMGGLLSVWLILKLSTIETIAQARQCEQTVTWIYCFEIIPGACVAVLAGILLIHHHGWNLMLRQRWMRVKIMLAGVTVGGLHVLSRMALLNWRGAIWGPGNEGQMKGVLAGVETGELSDSSGITALQPPAVLEWVSLIGLILLVGVVVFGRIKPRLGQNWAKDYPR